jgi:hypothetical protein
MGQAGRAFVAANYNRDELAARMLALLQKTARAAD